MNYYQQRTPETKMKGQVFTPQPLANTMVSLVSEHLFGVVVDPACGEGVFLVALLEARLAALEKRRSLSPADRAAKAVDGLVGFDIDPACLEKARLTLSDSLRSEFGKVSVGQPILELGNVLEPPILDDPANLRAFKMRAGRFGHGADLIIGNPPYVEAKRLHEAEKKRLRREFPEAGNGPVDLFVYFAQAALDRLAPGGTLAFVLPNKFLVAGYAERLRQRMMDEFELRHVLFLSHLDVFAGTSVYPVVAVASRRNGRSRPRVRLYSPPPSAPAEHWIKSPRSVPARIFSATETRSIFPVPSGRKEQRLLERLVGSLAAKRMGDLLDIRWTISFHAGDLRDKFVFEKRPDSPNASRFLGGGRFSGNAEVQRYRIKWDGWWIDYDERRAAAAHNQLPSMSLFERPKIVICQNALRLRAAVDEDGYVLKDTFLAGIPRDNGHLLSSALHALAGLLNSDVAHFYYSHVFKGGHVGGGYLHYLAPYVRDIPVGRWTSTLVEMASRSSLRASSARSVEDYQAADRALQSIVGDAFGLDDNERRIIADFAARSGDKGPIFGEPGESP